MICSFREGYLFLLFTPRKKAKFSFEPGWLPNCCLKLVLLSNMCWLGWTTSEIVNDGTHYLGHDGDFASSLASAQYLHSITL